MCRRTRRILRFHLHQRYRSRDEKLQARRQCQLCRALKPVVGRPMAVERVLLFPGNLEYLQVMAHFRPHRRPRARSRFDNLICFSAPLLSPCHTSICLLTLPIVYVSASHWEVSSPILLTDPLSGPNGCSTLVCDPTIGPAVGVADARKATPIGAVPLPVLGGFSGRNRGALQVQVPN